MAFEGLLGGGGGDPLDLYGDLFTDKQRAALRQRELSSGLLRFAEKLGAASAPSRTPKGSFLGLLGQSLGGFAGGDEAANKQLEAMALAEKVRQSKSQRELAAKTIPFFWKVAGGGIVQGTSDTPPAPGAVPLGPAPAGPGAPAGQPPSATAADAAAAAPSPQTPAMPWNALPQVPSYNLPSPADPALQGNAIPPQQAGLLPPPPGANPQMGAPGGVLSADLYGGGTGSPLPFSGGGLPGAAWPDLQQLAQLMREDAGGGGDAGEGDWQRIKPLIRKYESGGRNIEQGVVGPQGGYNPSVGRVTGPSSASGYYQMIDPTWRSAAAKVGIDTQKYPRAINAPEELQDKAAEALYREQGLRPWAPYNRALAAATGYSGGTQMAAGGRPDLSNMAGDAGGGGDAGAGQGGQIPGLNMTPQQLGAFNALFKMSGLGDPFGSLLETYYKSPGYLAEKARTEAKATKNVALEMDPLIAKQVDTAKAKVDLEWKPKIEEAVQKLQSPILQEREQAKADIARMTKEIEINQTAARTPTKATVFGPGGVVSTEEMTAYEFARRQNERAGRVAKGDTTFRPGDIVPTPTGAAPAEHEYIMTPQGGISARSVPGTPAAQKAADAIRKQEDAQYQVLQNRDIVVGTVDRIEGMLDSAVLPTTGATGSWLSNLGGTAANNIRAAAETLKARLSIDEINRIRNSNPTGAAFGNLTEKEGERVAAAQAALDQSQSEPEFRHNLRLAKQIYLDATSRARLPEGPVLNVPPAAGAKPPATPGAPREGVYNPKTGRVEYK